MPLLALNTLSRDAGARGLLSRMRGRRRMWRSGRGGAGWRGEGEPVRFAMHLFGCDSSVRGSDTHQLPSAAGTRLSTEGPGAAGGGAGEAEGLHSGPDIRAHARPTGPCSCTCVTLHARHESGRRAGQRCTERNATKLLALQCTVLALPPRLLAPCSPSSYSSLLPPGLYLYSVRIQAEARLVHSSSRRVVGRDTVQVYALERWQRAAPQPRGQVSAAGVGDLGAAEVEPLELRQRFSLRRRRICRRRRHEGGKA